MARCDWLVIAVVVWWWGGRQKVPALTLNIHNFLRLKQNPVKFATFPKIYLGAIGYGM